MARSSTAHNVPSGTSDTPSGTSDGTSDIPSGTSGTSGTATSTFVIPSADFLS